MIYAHVPRSTPKTNADRIRAMSDEELARHLNKLTDSYPGVCRELPECHADLDADRDIPLERCEGCWIAWLRQPSEYLFDLEMMEGADTDGR